MQHLVLALVTIAIIRFAWVNFKRLGTLRSVGAEITDEQRQLQMKYATRIIFCLVALAIAPFAFTWITK